MLVSHIIPAFNQYYASAELLESMYTHTHPDDLGEIIFIDNGSKDATQGIYADYPINIYIRNQDNMGFPYVVNQGIKLAGGKYICVWNNDMVVSPGWWQALKAHIDKPGYGMVTGQLTERFEMDLETFKIAIRSQTTDELMDWHKGGPWLFKAEVFEDIGLFDEQFYPTQYEDSDIQLRMALAKWKYAIVPGCKIYHYSGLTQYEELLPAYGSFDYARENRQRFEDKWGTIHMDVQKAYETGDYYGKPS